MSGITDGYHQDLDEENFDNSETEAEFDDPEPEDDADSESEPVGPDEDSDFLHHFAAAIIGGLSTDDPEDADPEDDDEIGFEDDDLEASEEEEDEEEAFLTDDFVTVSYVNNKLAFRKGDLLGEIFAYTEVDPSTGSHPPRGKLAIDGSKLYTTGPSRYPVEIQVNHGNFMFFDLGPPRRAGSPEGLGPLAANNSTGALLAEVDQLYDDNGDPLTHNLSTENNRPKVTLFFNSELLTLAAKSAPVTVSTGFRAPVVQLPSFRPSTAVSPVGSVPPQSKIETSNNRNTPSPPHGVHGTPATSFHPASFHRPQASGSSEDRSRAATGSPRSGINQFAPSITGPLISTEIPVLRQGPSPAEREKSHDPLRGQGHAHPPRGEQGFVRTTDLNPHVHRAAPPTGGVSETMALGPPKIRLKISAPSTPSYAGPPEVGSSGGYSNGRGVGNLPPPTGPLAPRADDPTMPSLAPRGGFTGGARSLPGVKSINSYRDLLVIDQGEAANMYASRTYLAGVINEAPLYLLGVERQFTPEAVIVISRMLNNRLWLKTRYSEIHDEILDLLIDICPELNGLPD